MITISVKCPERMIAHVLVYNFSVKWPSWSTCGVVPGADTLQGVCFGYDGGGCVHFGPAVHCRMVNMSSLAGATIDQPVFTTPFRSSVFLLMLDRVGSSGVTMATAKWCQLQQNHRESVLWVTIRAQDRRMGGERNAPSLGADSFARDFGSYTRKVCNYANDLAWI